MSTVSIGNDGFESIVPIFLHVLFFSQLFELGFIAFIERDLLRKGLGISSPMTAPVQKNSAITISPIRWRYMNNDLKNSQVWILNHL